MSQFINEGGDASAHPILSSRMVLNDSSSGLMMVMELEVEIEL